VPEGHTIHRIAEDQNRDLSGQVLQVYSPQGRFEAGAAMLNGQILTQIDAYGKHIIYHWETQILHVHLGLYGKFHRHKSPPPEPRGQVRMRIVGKQHCVDLNGPTACELYSEVQLGQLLSRLGPDPLRSDSDPDRAWQKIGRSRSAIGAVLMDQSVIAGIGNIYRSEILYLLQIHPNRIAKSLTHGEFDALWKLSVNLLQTGKRYNRIITTSPSDIGKARSRMNRDERLLIYKKPYCGKCQSPILSWKLAARTVFACPGCQILPAQEPFYHEGAGVS
jgi:endonuclease VIII